MQTAGIASCWMKERRGSDAIEDWKGLGMRRKGKQDWYCKSHSYKCKRSDEWWTKRVRKREIVVAAFRVSTQLTQPRIRTMKDDRPN